MFVVNEKKKKEEKRKTAFIKQRSDIANLSSSNIFKTISSDVANAVIVADEKIDESNYIQASESSFQCKKRILKVFDLIDERLVNEFASDDFVKKLNKLMNCENVSFE